MRRLFDSLSLRARLLLGLIVSALILLAVASFALGQYNAAVRPIGSTLAETLSRERVAALQTLADSVRVSLTRLVADQALIDNYVVTTAQTVLERNLAVRAITVDFQRVLNTDPRVLQLRFLSTNGTGLVSVPPLLPGGEADPFVEILQAGGAVNLGQTGMYIGPLRTQPAAIITFALPVVSNNVIVGYIALDYDPTSVADVTLPSLYQALQSVNFQAGNIVFYFIRADGSVESPYFPPLIQGEARANNARSLANVPFIQAINYVSPLTNRPALGFGVPVSGLDRVLMAEAQLVQVVQGGGETGQFVARLLLVMLLSLGTLGLIALFYEAVITRPFKALADLSMRASLGQRVQISGGEAGGEFGTMARAISALTSVARQDIAELEARVAQRTRDVEATREIGQILSTIRDLDTLLNRVIELIRARFETIYHAQVFIIDPTGQFATLRASTGEAGEKLLARGHRLAVGSISVIGRTTAEGRSVVALDTSRDPIHRVNELLPDTRAELALPLRTGQGTLGALDLQSKRADAFTEADIALFQSVADQLAIAITNVRLFEESNARLAEIEGLNRRLLGEAWRSYATVRRRAMPGTSQLVPQSDTWSALQREAAARKTIAERFDPDQVTFAVPVILRDQVIGAVEWSVPRASYNENTRLLAWELAARLAVSADNVRLSEQSQRLVARERIVNEITNKLVQQPDVERVLQTAVRELGLALRAPNTAIRLATTDTSQSTTVELKGEEE